MSDILLDIRDLSIIYATDDGVTEALNGACLQLRKGESLGLVGETGAGKTTLARGIMRLIPNPPGKIVSGQVFYDGCDIMELSEKEMRALRGRQISMIFQDPMTSLNPVMTVGEQIREVIITHHPNLSKAESRKQAEEMLEMVGIVASRYDDYPHQFSGGMKQRVVIAMALALKPDLVIFDEPTTALDVVVQYNIIRRIIKLKDEMGFAILFITHDLPLMLEMCDRIAVMYAGSLVEVGPVEELSVAPQHPYTKGLLNAFPSLVGPKKKLRGIGGSVPDLITPPPGCLFYDRCFAATPECRQCIPKLEQTGPYHYCACHHRLKESDQ